MDQTLGLFLVVLISLCQFVLGEHEDAVSLITSEAKSLSRQSYEKDPYWFYQSTDPRTETSTYHWPKGDRLGEPVFYRSTSDEGKEVVVLGSGEDRLRETLVKRTFVVLIKDKSSKKIYHPIYAYAR
jgi:hypothetical protein